MHLEVEVTDMIVFAWMLLWIVNIQAKLSGSIYFVSKKCETDIWERQADFRCQ